MKTTKALMTNRRVQYSLTAAASLVAFALICQPAPVRAQANRGTSTSGMFGNTTLGGTSGASPAGLGSGMTQGMSANSAQGGSGTNNNAGAGGGANPSGAAGMQNLQAGGATGFIGTGSQNIGGNVYASGQRGQTNQNFNALTQLMAKAQQNQFNQQQAQKNARGNTQAQSQFRVPLRIGFQPQPVPSTAISGYVQRLPKIPGLARIGPIQASLEGRTAVLRGTVASEADRQLAEGLARLEPAVMAVRNELVVGNPTNPGTTVEALPPASAGAR